MFAFDNNLKVFARATRTKKRKQRKKNSKAEKVAGVIWYSFSDKQTGQNGRSRDRAGVHKVTTHRHTYSFFSVVIASAAIRCFSFANYSTVLAWPRPRPPSTHDNDMLFWGQTNSFYDSQELIYAPAVILFLSFRLFFPFFLFVVRFMLLVSATGLPGRSFAPLSDINADHFIIFNRPREPALNMFAEKNSFF